MSTIAFEANLDFFPNGVQYHRAPTPLRSEWDGDLREIARCGYTHVQYRPQWRCHERIRGKPVWDDLDTLFDLAQKHGLRVVLKPMLETAPDWVFSELQGTRIGLHGIPISPFAHGAYYVGGWWPCFENPAVVEAATGFVRALVERYHQHPALWFYNAWNEPVSRPISSCQCCHSAALYRTWLAARFGTIENLNDFLGKSWTSFASVVPPQAADDYAELFLWRQWAGHAIGQHVGFVARTIREADPKAFLFVHAGGSMITQDPLSATTDDFENVKSVDRYGTSFGVVMHPKHPVEHSQPDVTSDWLRRVDPSYWCHEFYSNEHNWSIPPENRCLKRQIWMAIAGGPAGFTHWQWRSERVGCEVNGAGMREMDGSPSARSGICDEIAMILQQKGKALIGAPREAGTVAILYHRTSDMMMRVQEVKNWVDGFENERGSWSGNATPMKYKRAIHTAHALYVHAGHSVDWVVPGDDLSRYPLLHVTNAELIESATADWLRDYVRQGGRLVVEFPFACRDDNTWVSLRRPNNGLEDLLGCREAERLIVNTANPAKATFAFGANIEAVEWRVMFALAGGTTVATWQDGRSAAVRHAYGRGTVISLGVNLSLAIREHFTDDQVSLFMRAVEMDGSTGQHQPLWIRRRRSATHEVWFVFNVHAEEHSVELPAIPLAIWTGADCALTGHCLSVPAGEVWVAEMPRQA